MASHLGTSHPGPRQPGQESSRGLGHAASPGAGGDANPGASTRTVVHRPRWQARFSRAVMVSDLIAVSVVIAIGHVLGLGDFEPRLGGVISPWLGIVIAILTAGCLFVMRAWDPRVLGQGSEEFSRLIKAFVTSAVVLGLVSLAMELSALRPWVFGLLPLAGALSLAGRFTLRKWLHANRVKGRFVHPTLVIGTPQSAAGLIERARRDLFNGWEVRGACTPTGEGLHGQPDILGVPVLGDLDSAARIAGTGEFHVVSVCDTPGWSPRRLHQLAWDLEGLNTELTVDPGLMEVAGPRLHVSPVDGFPMLRLTEPVFDGVPRVAKNVIDWLAAALITAGHCPGHGDGGCRGEARRRTGVLSAGPGRTARSALQDD